MKPHPNNFCGGNYQDWAEVMLTPKCNGKCAWCVENGGFKPKDQVPWHVLANKLIESGKKNVILLGGEPTLYEDLELLCEALYRYGLNVYITTNGSNLERIAGLSPHLEGVNLSIHHFDLKKNAEITGIEITSEELDWFMGLHGLDHDPMTVRFNCTCFKGGIDHFDAFYKYLDWAKRAGANEVRFAEMKGNPDAFVNLAPFFSGIGACSQVRNGLRIQGDKFEPFRSGCNQTLWWEDIRVSFRFMCGLQTPCRPRPQVGHNDQVDTKAVLYYNGQFYDSWQRASEHKEEQLRGMKTTDTTVTVQTMRVLNDLVDGIMLGNTPKEVAINRMLTMLSEGEVPIGKSA